MLSLSLLLACAEPPSAPAPPPPHELTLTASNLVAGAPLTLTVTGGAPGGTVAFAWSSAGLGLGVCPPALQGRCTDIRATVHPISRTLRFNNAGTATLQATLPAGLAGQYIAVQAAALGATFGLSNPVGRPVGAPGTPLDPLGDLDGDGVTIADGDCADFDPSFRPGVADAPGDGIDHDCDNRDGRRAACVHPSAATLAGLSLTGASDIVFGPDCSAYVATIISGTDELHVVDPAGGVTTWLGYSNYDITAIALLPDGTVGMSHNNDHTCFAGRFDGTDTNPLTTGVWTLGALWTNPLLNRCASSVAADETCLYVPNLAGDGTLACVEPTTGTSIAVTAAPGRIETIVTHPSLGVLYASGNQLYEAASGTTYATLPGDVRDMAVDPGTGALFIELATGELMRMEGPALATFATVTGQGKLTVSPDGWLVRIVPDPVGLASFEEWAL
jgi:hypothetical protein